jgi:hypothetical protein
VHALRAPVVRTASTASHKELSRPAPRGIVDGAP